MELERKYGRIYKELERTPCTNEELEEMKIHFRSDIDSERVFERISSIGVLLRWLEKRDSLNSHNIGCLKYVAQIVKRVDIIPLLLSYVADRTAVNVNSLYAVETTPFRAVEATPFDVVEATPFHAVEATPFQRSYLLTPPNQQQVLQDIALDPIDRVFDLISSEIGQKWKNFARALQIKEGNIDDLESKYSSITERVRRILHFHRQNAGEQHWKRKLCDALDKARRKDLREKVQEIFAEHGMM